MSLAVLFPGQGVQHAGLLRWLDDDPAAGPVLAQMGAAIGAGWRQRLDDAAWSEANHVAQCLVTGTSLAAWRALRQAGLPAPAAVAGYSVGELAAFSVAGVIDDGTALTLATARAAAMDHSAAGRPGGLLAVSGLSARAVTTVCDRWSLQLAIQIAADRCLLGGPVAALDAAAVALAAQGAEVQRLRIRIASHTAQMQAAAVAFAAVIAPQSWQQPATVLICNRTGTALRLVPELKRCLAEQIDNTVQWQRAMQTLAERRPRCMLEVGAGSTLSRLWLAAHPEVPSRSADEFGSAADVVAWVKACIGRAAPVGN